MPKPSLPIDLEHPLAFLSEMVLGFAMARHLAARVFIGHVGSGALSLRKLTIHLILVTLVPLREKLPDP